MLTYKTACFQIGLCLALVLIQSCQPNSQLPTNKISVSFPTLLGQNSNTVAKIANQTKSFPEDIGWINVKKEFGAKGDGISDDTAAIMKAITAPYGDYTRPKILYFPAGTYLVSDTLQFRTGSNACCVTFQGQGKGQTIIKLQDNATGFDRKIQPKAVIKTNTGNAAFRNFIRDLTINTGNNNPGSIGIDYISNNRGGIVNVQIRAEDGQGQIGLSMIRQWPGPSLIKHLTIEGFDYGIHTRHPEYGLVLEHIELREQNVTGILNEGNTLAVRSLKSENSVPAIHNKNGLVIAIDGQLDSDSLDNNDAAINNQGYLYARNLRVKNYQSAIKSHQETIAQSSVEEYISHPAYSLFDSPEKSLNLPIEETPDYNDHDLNNWANVEHYSSVQAAMNSGKSTIYFPMGQHKLNETIEVPTTVKKIVGFESFINLNQPELQAVFKVARNSRSPLIIEGLLLESTLIQNKTKRTLAFKHTKFGKKTQLDNISQAGKLFLEDVQMNLQVNENQKVWARQLNSETLFEGKTKITNAGGKIWILGLKTEGKGTVIETTEGGKTELLGTLIYPVEEFNSEERTQAAFINKNSSHSLIYSVSAYGGNRNYEIQVKEIRQNKTKKLYSSQIEDLKVPLFVGY